MPLKQKGEITNPHIPEDYYIAELAKIKTYERDNKEAHGLILDFYIEDEDVTVPFFAPAKLSVSDKRQSSRLASNLRNIGMLEAVLEEMDIKPEILEDGMKWVATDRIEAEDLIDLLKSVFRGKSVRVNVEDGQDGDSSQVSKLSKLFDEDEEE